MKLKPANAETPPHRKPDKPDDPPAEGGEDESPRKREEKPKPRLA